MAENIRLKFFVDVGVGRKVEKWLQSQGHDAKCVRDLDSRMPDTDILRIANAEERMILTMDKDFGELIYKFKLSHCGVLLLRLDDAHADEKVEVVKNILEEYSGEILNKFCVFKQGSLRIRKHEKD